MESLYSEGMWAMKSLRRPYIMISSRRPATEFELDKELSKKSMRVNGRCDMLPS